MTIPQPKGVYEYNGNGTDAKGVLGEMVDGTYSAGLLSSALEEGQAHYDGAPGINLTGALSAGFWMKVTAGFLADYGPVYLESADASANKAWQLKVEASGGGDVAVTFNNAQISRTATPSVGWHYFSFSRAADGTTKLFMDGVQLSTSAATTFTATGSDSIVATIGDGNAYGLMMDQAAIWEAEVTAAEFLEVVNSGAGLAWANPWSAGGGAGARRVGNFGIGIANRIGI